MGIEREGGGGRRQNHSVRGWEKGKTENNYPEEGWWRRKENYLVSYVTL